MFFKLFPAAPITIFREEIAPLKKERGKFTFILLPNVVEMLFAMNTV